LINVLSVEKSTSSAVIIIVSVLVVFLVSTLIFLFIRRQKSRKEIQSGEDLNPVYGLYYFEDGQQIDDKNAEAIDENQDYEN